MEENVDGFNLRNPLSLKPTVGALRFQCTVHRICELQNSQGYVGHLKEFTRLSLQALVVD